MTYMETREAFRARYSRDDGSIRDAGERGQGRCLRHRLITVLTRPESPLSLQQTSY